MAVQHLDSTTITLMEATPRTPVDGALQGGGLRVAKGVVTPAADDTANSTYRFCRIPSNAIVHQVLINAADATTAGAVNIGLWDTESNGDAVVDADLFASALDLSGGPYNNSDQTFESGEYTLAESETRIWEVLGLSEDSHKEYDVVAQVSTTFNGGPTAIQLTVYYSV